jgi:hypothetical protein
MASQQSNGGKWTVETTPGNGTECVGVGSYSPAGSKLTAAGIAAVQQQVHDYHNTNAGAMVRAGGQPVHVDVTPDHVIFTTLPADQASQATSLLTLLNTAANVT